jgi:hypothetical protein
VDVGAGRHESGDRGEDQPVPGPRPHDVRTASGRRGADHRGAISPRGRSIYAEEPCPDRGGAWCCSTAAHAWLVPAKTPHEPLCAALSPKSCRVTMLTVQRRALFRWIRIRAFECGQECSEFPFQCWTWFGACDLQFAVRGNGLLRQCQDLCPALLPLADEAHQFTTGQCRSLTIHPSSCAGACRRTVRRFIVSSRAAVLSR